jgi:hypothetical protein
MRKLGIFAVFVWFGAIAMTAGCAGTDAGTDFSSGGSAGSDAGTDASDANPPDSTPDANPGASDGTACSSSSECASHWCVDGVCCESSCDGSCRSCVVAGKVGKCTLIAAGTDPDGECGDPADDCSGTCDGTGACAYPGSEKSCGTASCTDGKQTLQTCDGSGTCGTQTTDCGAFQCGGSTCLSSCSGDGDCTPDAWCNAPDCEKKKANGQACSGDNECTSGVCASGTCCNVSCDSPASCSTGTCLCGGAACATGEACITWYADTDADGYGDPSKPALGCESTGPSGGSYATNGDDCYDTNPNAKPGQTAYFTTDRGDGSFDYNCDAAKEYQYGNVNGLTCGDCGIQITSICYSCGTFSGVNTYGFGCNSTNKCQLGGYKQGYDHVVDCGQYGNLESCAMCSTTVVTDSNATQQGCH